VEIFNKKPKNVANFDGMDVKTFKAIVRKNLKDFYNNANFIIIEDLIKYDLITLREDNPNLEHLNFFHIYKEIKVQNSVYSVLSVDVLASVTQLERFKILNSQLEHLKKQVQAAYAKKNTNNVFLSKISKIETEALSYEKFLKTAE
jgi:hypothetical protein